MEDDHARSLRLDAPSSATSGAEDDHAGSWLLAGVDPTTGPGASGMEGDHARSFRLDAPSPAMSGTEGDHAGSWFLAGADPTIGPGGSGTEGDHVMSSSRMGAENQL
ncbi:hypothetical protein [Acrocarpospora macrocephala]|nr:hypothetical protein [Acrocarpospora macrocephala]